MLSALAPLDTTSIKEVVAHQDVDSSLSTPSEVDNLTPPESPTIIPPAIWNDIKKSRVYLLLILPSLIASIGLGYVQEPLITLVIFHVALLMGVLKYSKKTNINFTKQLLDNLSQQRVLGFLAASFVLCSVLVAYSLLPIIFPGVIERVTLPFKSYSIWYLALLAIEFAVINPILEELYWNVFLYKTIHHIFKGKKRYIVKLELFFAIYHFFTILFIFDFRMAVLGFVLLFIAGLGFLYIRHRFGFLVAALAHFGADLAVVICFVDIIAKRNGLSIF